MLDGQEEAGTMRIERDGNASVNGERFEEGNIFEAEGILQRLDGWMMDMSRSMPNMLVWRNGSEVLCWNRRNIGLPQFRAKPAQTPKRYIADNSVFRSENPGIHFRGSKNVDDRKSIRLDWGRIVEGVDDGNGWLEVEGNLFLPTHIVNMRVLKAVDGNLQTPGDFSTIAAARPSTVPRVYPAPTPGLNRPAPFQSPSNSVQSASVRVRSGKILGESSLAVSEPAHVVNVGNISEAEREKQREEKRRAVESRMPSHPGIPKTTPVPSKVIPEEFGAGLAQKRANGKMKTFAPSAAKTPYQLAQTPWTPAGAVSSAAAVTPNPTRRISSGGLEEADEEALELGLAASLHDEMTLEKAQLEDAQLEDALARSCNEELESKKISELKKKAKAEGIPNQKVADTDDAEDTKAALIELILENREETKQTCQAYATARTADGKRSGYNVRHRNDELQPKWDDASDKSN